jgi:dienelactone hydrolase
VSRVSWRAATAVAVLVLSFAPPAQAQAEEIVARDLREETQRIPVTVKDMYGRQETKQIPITIFRPRGDGPFPLVIMNHGRATPERRAQQGRQRYEDLSRYLVAKGFVVLLPTRVGYAESYGDFDPEATGTCNARRLEPMADAVFDQVMATLAFAKTLPFVDASRWIVAGQSAGGLTAVVTVGKHPSGLIAGINFAGGSGGDPDNSPQRPCSPKSVARLWGGLAGEAAAPMIWLYWQNDQYWGPEIPKQWHAAWVAGGGKAEFHSFPAVGKDGHGGSGIDMDHWVPVVDDFLVRLGFTKPGLVARPAPSGFAAIDEADKVPISPASREGPYRRFLDARMPRAFAVGPRGAWAQASGDWVLGKALGRCERSGGGPCKLYAVDADVVWTP